MNEFEVTVVFDVGDPESVARFVQKIQAANPAQAVFMMMAKLVPGENTGFTQKDVIQVLVTDLNNNVASNLLLGDRK